MLKYILCVVFLVFVTCVLYLILDRQFKHRSRDPHIPRLLTQDDIWLDGLKIMYRYDGDWYEAVARTKNSIMIYDVAHDKIVSVPFIVKEK